MKISTKTCGATMKALISLLASIILIAISHVTTANVQDSSTISSDKAKQSSCQGKALRQLIQPYSIEYDAKYKGVSIDNTRTLKWSDEDRVTINGQMSLWFMAITEFSVIEPQESLSIRPVEYKLQRKGLSSSKDYHLNFQWDENIAKNRLKGDSWEMPIQPGYQDMLSHQLQFRLQLLCDEDPRETYSFPLIKKKRERTYSYKLEGEELLKTPLGDLNTLHFVKQERKPGRTMEIWLAKDWDFLIAKLRYQEDGDSSHQLSIKKGTLGNQKIVGL